MSRYRPNSHARRDRSGRTYVDHDVFAGLPVRQWRKSSLTVGVPPQQQSASRTLQPELPLPKEAHLLSPMSLALLQAARAGVLNKPPPTTQNEDETKEEEEKPDNTGFTSIKWSGVPRHLEEPEVEYLAKKRKIYDPKAIAAEAERERLHLARLAALNAPPGSTVAGEVMAADGIGLAGMAVDGQLPVDPQPRRKAPPIRKKTKSAGRGRKKKVQFTPVAERPAVEGEAAAATGEGDAAAAAAPVDTEMTEDHEHEEGEEDEEDEDEEGDEEEEGEEEGEGVETEGDAIKPEVKQESEPASVPAVAAEILQDTIMTDAPPDGPPPAPVPEPATLPQQPVEAQSVPQDSDWEIVDASEAIPTEAPVAEAIPPPSAPVAISAVPEDIITQPEPVEVAIPESLPPPIPIEPLSVPEVQRIPAAPVAEPLSAVVEPATAVAEAPIQEEHAVPITDLLQTPTPQTELPPPPPAVVAAVPQEPETQALPPAAVAEMLAVPHAILPAEEMAVPPALAGSHDSAAAAPIDKLVTSPKPTTVEALPSSVQASAPPAVEPVTEPALAPSAPDAPALASEPPTEEVKVDALLNPAPEPTQPDAGAAAALEPTSAPLAESEPETKE